MTSKRSVSSLIGILIILCLVAGCSSVPMPKSVEQLEYPELEFVVPEIRPMTLPSGAKLYLLPDDELPLVEVTLMVPAGEMSMPEPKAAVASLFATTLRTGGTEALSAAEVDRLLEQMAASLSVSSDTYATEFRLNVHAESFEPALRILFDLLRNPAFDENRLEIARRQGIEAVRRQNDQPASIAQRTLRNALYNGHVLGASPTEEGLEAVSRKELVDFHSRYFRPDQLWIGVSGDVDPEGVDALIAEALDGWSPPKGKEQEIVPLPPVEKAAFYVANKELSQTTVLMGRRGLSKDSPELFPARVMNYILGGGGFNSRLMREIRSNRGLAYSVYSYFQVGRHLPGPFILGVETRNEKVPEVLSVIEQELSRMMREPVSDAELRLAKESLVNSFVFAFTESHEMLTQQMRLDFYDYPSDYLQRYRERVQAVDKEAILKVAGLFLYPEELNAVLVGERQSFEAALEDDPRPIRSVSGAP